MKGSIAGLLLLTVLAASPACGGSDDEATTCAAPITLTPGTWCITITGTVNSCSSPVGAPYEATFTQSGSALSVLSEFGYTYDGVVCGNGATVSAKGPPADVQVQITFSNPSTGTGTAQWNTGSCAGTDTFTAAAGACPP